MNKRKKRSDKQLLDLKPELERLYNEEFLTLKQIADKFGVGLDTSWKWMKKLGIKRRQRCQLPDKEILHKMYEERGLSGFEISKTFGLSVYTIYRLLKQYEIQVRNPKDRAKCGIDHPNWNGGRYIDHYGYVVITTKDGRKKEHRVIIENHLGRKLETWEHVHHINEIKHDNRIENLQVMNVSDHMKHGHQKGKNWIALKQEVAELRQENRNLIKKIHELETTIFSFTDGASS
jgi:transposase